MNNENEAKKKLVDWLENHPPLAGLNNPEILAAQAILINALKEEYAFKQSQLPPKL